MIPKLKNVWLNILDPKFKKGFIKYLSSLDYEEFYSVYEYYTKATYTLKCRYTKNKIKFLSKKWFKYQILSVKYDEIFGCFIKSNPDFVIQANKMMAEITDKITKLIIDITERKMILENLASKPIFLPPHSTQGDFLIFYISIVCNIYNSEKLMKSMEELNNIKSKLK